MKANLYIQKRRVYKCICAFSEKYIWGSTKPVSSFTQEEHPKAQAQPTAQALAVVTIMSLFPSAIHSAAI